MTALYHLALDSGARRGELCGLLWQDIDLDKQQVSIMRQLTRAGASPQWGPPKNGQPRTVTLSNQTVELLRAHKAHQAQVKLANRHIYQEYGLVFAKDWWGVRTHGRTLGQPLQVTAIGQAAFKRLIALSGVTRITFHGLRHTCATLLLENKTQAHVVQKRLGHKRIEITLGIYAHVLPAMEQEAASAMDVLLRA